MPTIARRLAILTLTMSIFAISFAALATHDTRLLPCVSTDFGLNASTRCAAAF